MAEAFVADAAAGQAGGSARGTGYAAAGPAVVPPPQQRKARLAVFYSFNMGELKIIERRLCTRARLLVCLALISFGGRSEVKCARGAAQQAVFSSFRAFQCFLTFLPAVTMPVANTHVPEHARGAGAVGDPARRAARHKATRRRLPGGRHALADVRTSFYWKSTSVGTYDHEFGRTGDAPSQTFKKKNYIINK